MSKIGGFALALAGLSVMYGQVIKDPASPNPVVVSSRVQMVAYLEQAVVRAGDPVKLHFHLKNVSSGLVKYTGSGFSDDYWLMVTDTSGTEFLRTEKGDRLRRRSTSHVGTISDVMAPGYEGGDTVIDVAELYRLDRPGNYIVRIVRRIGIAEDPDDPRLRSGDPNVGRQIPIEEAVSDPIPFTIIP